MPRYKFGDSDNMAFEHLDGDYPFEVVSVEFGIQNGGKTNGSETMEMKVAFFKNTEFTQKLAQWTEKLIFHSSLEWKIDTFVKASNLLIDGKPPKRDAAIDFNEAMVVGLRGWATCKPEKDSNNKIDEKTGKVREYNRVIVWITSKPKLEKHVVVPVAEDDF